MGRSTMILAQDDYLVALVYKQRGTSREVYLPAGADWYNYWTRERLHGGGTIRADAPIDTLPLLVRAGSIIPIGEPILGAKMPQKTAKIQVYSGLTLDSISTIVMV